MLKPRVAVVRGGQSNEYEVSMKTGASVLQSLAKRHYQAKDIVITRQGEWLDGGKVRDPERTLTGIDTVFIALHGEHGEDGRVQRFLSHHHMPYTGSRALGSSFALNKMFTKNVASKHGIRTPRSLLITRDTPTLLAADIERELGETVVVKPASCGSSVDTHVAITAAAAADVVETLLDRYVAVLVEEYIAGKEVTVGLLEQFRGEVHYMLPVIEIVPPAEQAFYSYDAKYGGQSRYECPGRVSRNELRELYDITKNIHLLLDLRHYSRADFLIRDGEVYFLEVNTLPGLTEHSLFPKGLQAVGASYEDLVEHLVAMAHY